MSAGSNCRKGRARVDVEAWVGVGPGEGALAKGVVEVAEMAEEGSGWWSRVWEEKEV